MAAGWVVGILGVNLFNRVAGIGKVSETSPTKPFSRVDRYWDKKNRKSLAKAEKWIGRKLTDFEIETYANMHPYDFAKKYNFHSVEFGNWMNESDKINFYVAAQTAIEDLRRILKISKSQQMALGLGRNVSLAFGARGKGGFAMGHFEGRTFAINLTKTVGMYGVLGHEYAHAIDRYLGKQFKAGVFASGRRVTVDVDVDKLKSKNPPAVAFERLFKKLYYKPNGSLTLFGEFIERQPGDYWPSRLEVWARTFEVYLWYRAQKLGIKNGFLFKSEGYPVKDAKNVYPSIELIKKAEPEIDAILRLI